MGDRGSFTALIPALGDKFALVVVSVMALRLLDEELILNNAFLRQQY